MTHLDILYRRFATLTVAISLINIAYGAFSPGLKLKQIPRLGEKAETWAEIDANTISSNLSYIIATGPDDFPDIVFVLFFVPQGVMDKIDFSKSPTELFSPKITSPEELRRRKLTAFVEWKNGKAVAIHQIPEMDKDKVLRLASSLMKSLDAENE